VSRRDEIVHRIQFVKEQLSVLGQLVERLEGGASSVEPPTPVVVPAVVPASRPVAAEPVELLSKPRWSYQPGAAYRLVGVNPFRSDGNNFALFNHLVERFGESPFSFEQLTATIDALRADGTVDTEQTTDSFLRVFLRQGGLEKRRIAMASSARGAAPVPVLAAPAPVAASPARPRRPAAPRHVAPVAPAAPVVPEVPAEPVRRAPLVLRRRAAEVVPVGSSGAPAVRAPVAASDDLPPEAGDDAPPVAGEAAPPSSDDGGTYRIVRPPTFRGDTATRRIAEALGNQAFTRASITALVREMCADGRLVARRPVPLLVGDLLKVLREQDVLSET
jgi:hypothetical protein